MSEDAPSGFVNLPSSLTTTDAYRALSTWFAWRTVRNARHAYEKLTRGDGRAGDTRQVFPHAHGVQVAAPECGLVVRRNVVNQPFGEFGLGLTTSDWVEVTRCPGSVGGFVDVASEVKFVNDSNSVRFKIDSCPWNDSAAFGAADYSLAEAAGDATDHSAGVQWHTINESAGTGKELTIDPGTATAPGDSSSERGFILSARSEGGSCSMLFYHWRVWEIVTGDL